MQWFDGVLNSAGRCPVREAADVSSPCSGICERGLEPQVDANGSNVRWVTAAGWGNPDANLYIVGTTPKLHPATTAGPNYAAVDADRAEHAEWFATQGFADFILSPEAELRETTLWCLALARRWTESNERPSETAFFTELMLCPQTSDPARTRFRAAYRQCMSRHLLTLLGPDRIAPRPTLVLVGQSVALALYGALEISGPIPHRDSPVVLRAPDAEFSTPIIASQAVMGAKMARLNREAWVSRVIRARDSMVAGKGQAKI